jgi:glycosyltransferase involved in cell wall biosynthesis
MQALSVVIITWNEEKNIRYCIESVNKVANEIIVLDSFSSDRTVQIAKSSGAIVTQCHFSGYISQKNKAINLATNDYVLLIDADEMLSDELAASILEVKKDFRHSAYAMKRCNVFGGKFIKHGLWYPDKKLRLFNKQLGKCGGLNPHDKIIMPQGTAVKLLKGDLLHYSFSNAAEYKKRNEEISSIAAQSLYDAGYRKYRFKIIFSPLWSFVNGYFLRRGFFDGREGFIIAVHTAQQCFLKYQKLRLLQKQQTAALYAN